MKREDIQIRDPFILTQKETGMYYLYGTTDKNCWSEAGVGFDSYESRDLENWEGPMRAFRAGTDFWADRHFWAPEVYSYNGKYYMFASFKSPNHCRGTQVLVSDTPDGEFKPYSDGAVTPNDWECLDGTLYIDIEKKPWIVFCREWLQVDDGEMWAMRLDEDLKSTIGKPTLLFNASTAPWVKGSERDDRTVYVTDGPYMYRTGKGSLIMIWSSGSEHGYAIGIARSSNGDITGDWTHESIPLFQSNGGHGMIFEDFNGRLLVSLHSPNNTPCERPCFFEIEEVDDTLRIK